MCYSAMVAQHLKSLGLEFKARIDYALFRDLFKRRTMDARTKIPRAMEFNFQDASDQPGIEIKGYIENYSRQLIQELEQDLFAQKKRLADAERKLIEKPTKSAEKEKGIAERKIEATQRRLGRIQSDSERAEDSRIYALEYAPVIVWENGERVIKPMRYLCRPAGFPETFDRDFPGCYNARRDSLKKFWRKQYLHQHAILVISSFFENVKRGDEEKNVVLQFKPRGFDRMVIPCVWDRWTQEGQPDLYSFALITDEPPKEVSEAGHDRCPIFLKESNIEKWLRPEISNEAEIDALLADRETPYYENSQVA